MKIGTIDLGERPVMLAPMEDVTDVAFRLMCKRFGADMVYTEFVSADALIRGVNRSVDKLRVSDEERPVAIQIYGRDIPSMVEAAKLAEAAGPDILDINYGCPVKRVAGKGGGAGMLRNIPLMLEMTRAIVDAVHIPVTVKTRLGWDHEHKIIVELAEQLQDCGIQALTIHGRTRSQMYMGEADWTLIGQVKANPRMHIPIIGNGDITTPERALECFERYGVDGIMIGRASFGCPWIFREVKEYIRSTSQQVNGRSSESKDVLAQSLPSRDGRRAKLNESTSGDEACIPRVDLLTRGLVDSAKLDILRQQVRESVARAGEYGGILHIRRHLAATPLFKGIPNFRPTRIRMLRANTMDELFDIFDEIERTILVKN